MEPLRVALFTEVYRPIRNGIVTVVETLAEELRRGGHQAVCVAPAMSGQERDEARVLRLPSLPLPTRTGYRLAVPFLGPQARAMLRDCSLVHAHSPFMTGWMAAHLARRLRVPLVYTYHTQLEHYAHYAPVESRLLRRALRSWTRTYADEADLVIAPTPAIERYLRDLGVRARIEVLAGGIDLAPFERGRRDTALRARLGAGEGERLALCVGRLGKEKNHALALESFARMDATVKLAVVGDGPERRALEELARRLAPGRVRFLGESAREDLPDIYASGDVLLFASATETQGLVLVEALAAGLPIVALDTPQGRDVLGDAARLCEPDPQALARAATAALAENGASRHERVMAARRYDAAALALRMTSLYASLVGK